MQDSTILVIEDDPAIAVLIEEILRDEGYGATHLCDGAAAPATIRALRPDLVIIDLWLHERGAGWTLLEQVWRDPATATLPAILCSADTRLLDDKAAVIRQRPCAIVIKPFEIHDLVATVRRLLPPPPRLPDPGVQSAALALLGTLTVSCGL
jgi:DNA-binding response OmpR family regulator